MAPGCRGGCRAPHGELCAAPRKSRVPSPALRVCPPPRCWVGVQCSRARGAARGGQARASAPHLGQRRAALRGLSARATRVGSAAGPDRVREPAARPPSWSSLLLNTQPGGRRGQRLRACGRPAGAASTVLTVVAAWAGRLAAEHHVQVRTGGGPGAAAGRVGGSGCGGAARGFAAAGGECAQGAPSLAAAAGAGRAGRGGGPRASGRRHGERRRGSVRAPLHRAQAPRPPTVDVTNTNTVTVSFGTNPVGATFAGGVSELHVKMVQGVADMDIQVMQGGAGFTLKFSVQDASGHMLSVESSPFDCGGQEARLVLRQQPILTSEGAEARMTPAIVEVVDQYSKRLELANPMVTVSLFANPAGASFSASSQTSVRAVQGVATVDKAFLTRAATELEPGVPEHLEQSMSTKFRLRFSSPGFPDVISDDFETLPLVAVDNQPISDHTRTVTSTCSGVAMGNETSCMLHVSDYLQDYPRASAECQMASKPAGCAAPWASPADDACVEWYQKCLDKLQTAHLHVDVACTDLDGPDEYVTSVSVGARHLRPGVDFETGPWEGCGFAGCREQCDTNTRRVVSGLDVKDDVGSYHSLTQLYSSSGPPLKVQVAISGKVNICPCDGTPLKVTVRLVLTYSQAPEEQGRPLRQQPRLLLLNGDRSLYTHRQKFVSVAFAANPSGAVLAGTTRILSADGVAQFTNLAITEGGKGYVLRFRITGVYNPNSTSVVESQPLNVGSGNFPRLTIECIDCSRPSPSRAEARSLSQPPQLELQKLSADGSLYEKTQSTIEVRMMLGVNGPSGMFSRDTKTVRAATTGSVKFSDTTILNGNCAFCPLGNCGAGYTLLFITNDVVLESEEFNIAGGNRAPRFIQNTPAAGAAFDGVVAVPRVLFTLNMTDDNQNDFSVSLRSDQQDSVTCHPAATCLDDLNGGVQWGRKAQIVPQPLDDQCGRPLCGAVHSAPQPDECGTSENGPSSPPDGLYWGMSTEVTFAATCDLASREYPRLDSGALPCTRARSSIVHCAPPAFACRV